MQKQFSAQNIKCGGCAAAVNKALCQVAGVNRVEVDISSGNVTVHGDAFDSEAVMNKLEATGYPVKK